MDAWGDVRIAMVKLIGIGSMVWLRTIREIERTVGCGNDTGWTRQCSGVCIDWTKQCSGFCIDWAKQCSDICIDWIKQCSDLCIDLKD